MLSTLQVQVRDAEQLVQRTYGSLCTLKGHMDVNKNASCYSFKKVPLETYLTQISTITRAIRIPTLL